ncbi:MAG: branched-chain amino acid transport system II carrier protein [Flavobacteriaceae bacterium]
MQYTNKTKEIFIPGFALFALFFGAGDLILPPFLGFQSGTARGWVALGFVISAVAILLLGCFEILLTFIRAFSFFFPIFRDVFFVFA